MRSVEPRTFIMHRLTLYQMSYIPTFDRFSTKSFVIIDIFFMDERLLTKKKQVSLQTPNHSDPFAFF
jgi:hypothetical protein